MRVCEWATLEPAAAASSWRRTADGTSAGRRGLGEEGAPSSTTSTGSECLLPAGKGWRAREEGGPARVHVSSACKDQLCIQLCWDASVRPSLLFFFFGALSATRFLRSILTLSGGVFKMCVCGMEEGGDGRKEKLHTEAFKITGNHGDVQNRHFRVRAPPNGANSFFHESNLWTRRARAELLCTRRAVHIST